MRFFIEIQNNQPVGQGRIGSQVGPEHFFVRYDAPKKFGRVVSLKLMESFAVFDTEDELAQFVAAAPDKKVGDAVDTPTPPSAQ